MNEHELRDAIEKDLKLINKLTWEATNGKSSSAEEAAQEILGHPRRSKRFWKLFAKEDPKVLKQAVAQILRGLGDWEADAHVRE